MSVKPNYWWHNTTYDDMEIVCQESFYSISDGIWYKDNHVLKSQTSIALLYLPLFLIVYRGLCFLLKPIRMRIFTQLFVGATLGSLLTILNRSTKIDLFPIPFIYIVRLFSFLGYILHLFMLGVETNIEKLSFKGKKLYLIAYTSVIVSLAFSVGAYTSYKGDPSNRIQPTGFVLFVLFGGTSYLLTTSSHLNDLGISNSEIGRLIASVSMASDLTMMLSSLVFITMVKPIMEKKYLELLSAVFYLVLVFICRPLIIYILNLTPEGKPVKRIHFVIIVVFILVLAALAEIIDQRYSIFILALVLPEEPLASLLSERIDTFVSGIFFPFFGALLGLEADLQINKKISKGQLERVLFFGYVGKFVGAIVPSKILGLSTGNSVILSLISSSRGLLDLATLANAKTKGSISEGEYTIALIHALISGLLVSMARYFYKPARPHSSIFRQGIIDVQENGSFQTLACIFKEENISGLLHLLKLCNPLQASPNSVFALQLLPLSGRCTLPIMAPLHQVSSLSSFHNNISRSNRIVNAFFYLERETNGNTRVQHYIAMASHNVMHNDICNLAHEKSINLIILPFHKTWAQDGSIQDSSLSTRDVNNMVLEEAPCSVGILVDKRLGSHKSLVDDEIYNILLVFIGGADDYEAVAYSKQLIMNPNVRMKVICFKPPAIKIMNPLDYEVINQFRSDCAGNNRITFNDVVVDNGAETIEVIVSQKDDVDLVLLGKHHELMCTPIFGLSQMGWCEYLELGILGDILATSDFEFSLLVVQFEGRSTFDKDGLPDF